MRAFEHRHGITATFGGRHPGVGTANAITAVGSRQYLELIAVVDVDEAERGERGRRLQRALAKGETFATWVLRTDDLETVRSVLDEQGQIMPGARERPDGTRLEWRTLDLRAADAGSGIPFLISWGGAAHPGAGGDGRVTRLAFEDAAAGPLRALLDRVEIDVDYDIRDGYAPRLLQVDVELGGRSLTIG